ncbi:MAG: RyR domain-containing protein [Phaeospirillum sp.]|nr:RyR domain-containing protein [Phaeospirillum sp.]
MAEEAAPDLGDQYRVLEKTIESIRIDREKALRLKACVRMAMSVAAFCLGWWGYARVHQGELSIPALIHHAYQASQLLTFNMPHGLLYSTLPWQLQVARFALPGLAIYATIMTYIDFAKVPLASLWAARRRDHIIVAGDGARARDITKRCLADGLSLVAIQKEEGAEVNALRALGLTVIVGSIDSPNTFGRAGIAGARAVVLLTGSDSANLRGLASVDQAARANRPPGVAMLKVACDLQDRMMASVLSVALAEQRGGHVESHVIDYIDNVARQLVPRLAPVLGGLSAPHILVIGDDGMALQVARKVLLNAPECTRLTIIAGGADKAARTFYDGAPGVAGLCGVSFVPGGEGLEWAGKEVLDEAQSPAPADAVIISAADETAVALAILVVRWRRSRGLPPVPIFVRQCCGQAVIRAARLAVADTGQGDMLTAFGDNGEECNPDILLRGTLDRLARTIHETYLSEVSEGPSAVQWEVLDETYRESCRRQADHIHVKLARLGLVVQSGADLSALDPTDEQVEDLSRLEHWRWCVDRWLDGWTLGAAKDIAARTSPHLRPYDELSEEIKEFDRRAVRNMRNLLERTGLGVGKAP